MVKGVPRVLASRKELEAALASLSEAELAQLKQLASIRAMGLAQMDWSDLLQEALARALSGSRGWPNGVPLVAFLAQTMRSIANESWQAAQRADAAASDMADRQPESVDPETEAAAAETIRRVRALFDGDAEALAVLEGLAQGATPADIQRAASMTPHQYAAAQKRIRRRLAKHSSETNL